MKSIRASRRKRRHRCRPHRPGVGLESLEERMMLSDGLLGPGLLAPQAIDPADAHALTGLADGTDVLAGSGLSSQALSPGGLDRFEGDDGGGFTGNTGPLVRVGSRLSTNHTYMLHEHYGGWWHDAEKGQTNINDSNMCWAASAANVLAWTGWGCVDNFDNADDIYRYYQQHFENEGGKAEHTWRWWFDGSEPWWFHQDASVTTSHDGFFPDRDFDDYFRDTTDDSEAMTAIDKYITDGCGVMIGIKNSGSGAHAQTCWGFDYSIDPDTGNGKYEGIWLTDSDSSAGANPARDVLFYSPVAMRDGRWYVEAVGNDWYICRVSGLEQAPISVQCNDLDFLPDLIYNGTEHMNPVSDEVAAGDLYVLEVPIHNVGRANANPSHVEFYASDDTEISDDDHTLGSAYVGSIYAGKSAHARLFLSDFPDDVPVGTYNILVRVDPEGQIDESYESNNTGVVRQVNSVGGDVLDYQLTVERRDLSGSATTMTTQPVSPGDPWRCRFSIENNGTIASPRTSVYFFASTDTTLDADDHELGHAPVDRLAPFKDPASVGLSYTAFPNDLAPGEYHIIAQIDRYDFVSESNEDNNVICHWGTLTVLDTPDLYCPGVTSVGLGETTARPGDPWTCYADIANRGVVDAGPFSVAFHARRLDIGIVAAAGTTPDAPVVSYFLGSAPVAGVAQGDTVQAQLDLASLRSDLPAGQYAIVIRIDPHDDVREFNNVNNIGYASTPLTVMPGSDLWEPQSVIYRQDFSENNLPGPSDGWTVFSTTHGVVEVANGQLRMHSDTPGRDALNMAVLHVDLEGATGITLSLDHARPSLSHTSTQNEPNDAGLAPGKKFAGDVDADLIAFSNDGENWFVLDRLASKGHLSFDLDAAVTAAGIEYTHDFQIRFQQYGDSTWGQGGRAFDNVRVGIAFAGKPQKPQWTWKWQRKVALKRVQHVPWDARQMRAPVRPLGKPYGKAYVNPYVGPKGAIRSVGKATTVRPSTTRRAYAPLSSASRALLTGASRTTVGLNGAGARRSAPSPQLTDADRAMGSPDAKQLARGVKANTLVRKLIPALTGKGASQKQQTAHRALRGRPASASIARSSRVTGRANAAASRLARALSR